MAKVTEKNPFGRGAQPMFKKKMEHKAVIMLTPAQDKAVKEAAKASGKSVSTWAREILLAVAMPATPNEEVK